MAFTKSRPTERERLRLLVERSVLGHRLVCRALHAANPAPRGPTKLFSGPEFAFFGFQQPAQALDRAERVRMPIA
eukprot:scaffold72456_cov73-Phaeocystis_antarctica.AAC.3